MSQLPAQIAVHNPKNQVWPPSLGSLVNGSHSQVRVAWGGEDAHPGMPCPTSASSSQQIKELSIERAAIIFTEYLTYDKETPEQMRAFTRMYPWVLTEPVVCNAIVGSPTCYTALQKMDWWDTALANVNYPIGIAKMWLKQANVQALAYHTSDDELSNNFTWNDWNMLLQDSGLIYMINHDANLFARTGAFVVLANRLDVKLAPLMCAAMHVLIPLNALGKIVEGQWTPLQKAQYAWLLGKSNPINAWLAPAQFKQECHQAHQDLVSWQKLVDPQELANLTMIYALNNANVEDTVAELIRLAHTEPSTDSLDYTQALEKNEDAGV